MGLGRTAKKLQQVVEMADDLYAKINDLKSDLGAMRQTIDDTNERVTRIEAEMETQRELLDQLVEEDESDTKAEKSDV